MRSGCPFVPRPDLRGARAADWDEQVADLHYADTPEYATGYGVSADWKIVDDACCRRPSRHAVTSLTTNDCGSAALPGPGARLARRHP